MAGPDKLKNYSNFKPESDNVALRIQMETVAQLLYPDAGIDIDGDNDAMFNSEPYYLKQSGFNISSDSGAVADNQKALQDFYGALANPIKNPNMAEKALNGVNALWQKIDSVKAGTEEISLDHATALFNTLKAGGYLPPELRNKKATDIFVDDGGWTFTDDYREINGTNKALLAKAVEDFRADMKVELDKVPKISPPISGLEDNKVAQKVVEAGADSVKKPTVGAEDKNKAAGNSGEAVGSKETNVPGISINTELDELTNQGAGGLGNLPEQVFPDTVGKIKPAEKNAYAGDMEGGEIPKQVEKPVDTKKDEPEVNPKEVKSKETSQQVEKTNSDKTPQQAQKSEIQVKPKPVEEPKPKEKSLKECLEDCSIQVKIDGNLSHTIRDGYHTLMKEMGIDQKLSNADIMKLVEAVAKDNGIKDIDKVRSGNPIILKGEHLANLDNLKIDSSKWHGPSGTMGAAKLKEQFTMACNSDCVQKTQHNADGPSVQMNANP